MGSKNFIRRNFLFSNLSFIFFSSHMTCIWFNFLYIRKFKLWETTETMLLGNEQWIFMWRQEGNEEKLRLMSKSRAFILLGCHSSFSARLVCCFFCSKAFSTFPTVNHRLVWQRQSQELIKFMSCSEFVTKSIARFNYWVHNQIFLYILFNNFFLLILNSSEPVNNI